MRDNTRSRGTQASSHNTNLPEVPRLPFGRMTRRHHPDPGIGARGSASNPSADAISALPFDGDYGGESGAKLGWGRVQLDSDVDNGIAPHAHAFRLRNFLLGHLVIGSNTDGRDATRKRLVGERREGNDGFAA